MNSISAWWPDKANASVNMNLQKDISCFGRELCFELPAVQLLAKAWLQKHWIKVVGEGAEWIYSLPVSY